MFSTATTHKTHKIYKLIWRVGKIAQGKCVEMHFKCLSIPLFFWHDNNSRCFAWIFIIFPSFDFAVGSSLFVRHLNELLFVLVFRFSGKLFNKLPCSLLFSRYLADKQYGIVIVVKVYILSVLNFVMHLLFVFIWHIFTYGAFRLSQPLIGLAKSRLVGYTEINNDCFDVN